MNRILLYAWLVGSMLVWNAAFLCAQEQLGLQLDRYNPVSALGLNPARAAAVSPLRWELRLGGAHLFAENDYFFLRPASTLALWQARSDLQIYALPDIGDESKLPEGAFLLDFFQKEAPYQGLVRTTLAGPALWLRLGDHHALGISTSARAWFQAWRLPEQMGYYTFDSNPLGSGVRITPFEVTAQAWREWMAHYSYSWEGYHGNHTLGARVKWLRGYESLWLDLPQTVELVRLAGDTVLAPPAVRVSGGFTQAVWSGPEAMFQQPNGSGWAFDLGYSHTGGSTYSDWTWQWGVSLLDIGAIRYAGRAEWHEVQLDTAHYYARGQYSHFTSLDEVPTLIRQFSYETTGDSLASFRGNAYHLWLPSALSVQADVALSPWAWLGGMAVLPLPVGKTGSRRTATVALAPRLEHRWGSLTVPLVWYDWEDLRMGLAARLGWLTIGTDHLFSWTKEGTWTGTDFYVSLSLSPLIQGLQWHGIGGRRQPWSGRRRGGKVRCYEF